MEDGEATGSEGKKTTRSAEAFPTPTLRRASPSEIRAELESLIVQDLLGPKGGAQEELDAALVRDYYLVGMLAPKRYRVGAEEQDEVVVAGDEGAEDGPADPDVPHGVTMFPSSIGMTFAVDGGADRLGITARWGRYARTESETLTTGDGQPKTVWKRTPVEGTEVALLREGALGPWSFDLERPHVVVNGVARRHDGDWIVTLFLVNGQEEPDRLKDEAWVFQPEITVESPDRAAIFRKRPRRPRDASRMDPQAFAEEEAMGMIYRRHVEFAVGHGVAVHADVDPVDPTRAVRIRTRVLPAFEVPATTSPEVAERPTLAAVLLDMKGLSETPTSALAAKLGALPEAYAAWIEAERSKVDETAKGLADFRAAAQATVAACERVLGRIREGIALVAKDEMAAEAFRFANRAMWLQRTRSVLAERVRRGEKPSLEEVDTPANRSWYPFQLAFLLLNLPATTDLHHADRSHPTDAIADLLWFPTGGGKTEAYLGLAAYTMALRRLQGVIDERSGEYGVAVLMRYTLRLLTIQQFQRASALLCACEVLRREAMTNGDRRWGSEPFRIGLWVGMRTTPNTTEQSAEPIKRDHGHYRPNAMAGSGSPAQLTNCPWCGLPIEPGKNIVVETVAKGRGRTLTFCGDVMGRCPFTQAQAPDEGLPVLVVDEEIYRRLPALLIATVDKFAQMPWNGAVKMLFGQVNGRCTRHGFRSPTIEDRDSHPARAGHAAAKTVEHPLLRPPDLIIQDELHLISGPLGTLVGLYETAIDQLCTWNVDGKPVRPKLIASTATIRRAREQVHSLFLRRVEVFPPHGTDVRDNFFAVQREPSDETPGRRYLGICASGKRVKACYIRAYVALLGAAQVLYDKYGLAADPWMTLVGYFNTLRELGGMRRVVDDDVRTRLQKVDERGLGKRKLQKVEELTSRKGSTEIPTVLDDLEVRFEPTAKDQRSARKPIDVLLATNMVSVGVDVRRLGLMVVASQPKTTAEYIQATSRVGRRFPGLVVTVFNWARPRDISHYERFEHYHATFYQQVEALSVTPFAPRALDRGLSALLVSLVRLAGDEFNTNGGAARMDKEHEFVRQAVDAIVRRAERVSGSNRIAEDVRQQLARRLDLWLAQARPREGGSTLGYDVERTGLTLALLSRAGLGAWEDFTCLGSLRDVEPSVSLVLVNDGTREDSAGQATPDESGEPR